ncbi:hypothetical protein MRX96_019022 [Rhipicephalus microplus]
MPSLRLCCCCGRGCSCSPLWNTVLRLRNASRPCWTSATDSIAAPWAGKFVVARQQDAPFVRWLFICMHMHRRAAGLLGRQAEPVSGRVFARFRARCCACEKWALNPTAETHPWEQAELRDSNIFFCRPSAQRTWGGAHRPGPSVRPVLCCERHADGALSCASLTFLLPRHG